MPRYEVYATRLDSPKIVDLIPAYGLEFSMPLSEHGEASFTATVEPGRSFWRDSLALPVSGILIARDGVPIWQGWVTSERPSGPRSFSFTAKEWGHFFEEKVQPAAAMALPATTNDYTIITTLLLQAQAVAGQDARIVMPLTSAGVTTTSQWTIHSWDIPLTTVGKEIRSVGDQGPEWYFGTTGTLDNPVRQLFLGDRLGLTTAQTVLEFVEDTEPYDPASLLPTVTLLGGVFPGEAPTLPTRRAGGNLIAQSRTQDVAGAFTAAVAYNDGQDAAQKRGTAESSRLIAAGWPRMTKSTQYSGVVDQATLNRKAKADLAASAGIPTGYSLVSLDDDPDWTQVPRGSSVRVILDTDVYGAQRPVHGSNGFTARLLDTVVRVPDDGGSAQVEWKVAEVLEV